MGRMIFPEILDGYVMAFFTDKTVGTDVEQITGRTVFFPFQTHSDVVKVLGKSLKPTEADAVITKRHDVIIGVKTADCVPILLLDRTKGAIGVVHAGWRGTAKGILKKTALKMKERFGTRPEDLMLAMGPAIRWCCYEVDKDVLDAVVKATGKGDYFRKKGQKFCLDLQTANLYQAKSLDIKMRNISITEDCTFCYPRLYHSYRRSKDGAGRQGGFIGFP